MAPRNYPTNAEWIVILKDLIAGLESGRIVVDSDGHKHTSVYHATVGHGHIIDGFFEEAVDDDTLTSNGSLN